MVAAPCHNCSDRHLKCHAHCDRYQEYAQARQAIRDMRMEFAIEANNTFESIQRAQKRRRHRRNVR